MTTATFDEKMLDPDFVAQRDEYIARAAKGQVMLTGPLRLQYGISSDDVAKQREALLPPVTDDADDDLYAFEHETRTVQDIDLHLATLETTVAGMDKRIKDMTFRFTNAASISGEHVDEETRDRAWRAELPNLQEKERAILNEITVTLRTLQDARTPIDIIDQALDVDGATYGAAAAIVPMLERESAGLSGDQLAAKLRSVSLRKDRTLSLAWTHAARGWLEKHPSGTAHRGEVTKGIQDLERGFKSTKAKALNDRYARIEDAARKTQRRIERARQARGQVPDFLQGVMRDRQPVPGKRVHGYEAP